MKLAPSSARAFALLLPLLVAVPACSPPAPEEPIEIETVDVAPPIDAELSTEGDLQAAQRAARISGVVPGDLPADLPLFVPSSVTDFGSTSGGSFVELDAAEPPAMIRRWLGERLPANGWTIGAIGDELVQAHKGEQRVDIRLTDLAPGTRIRLEYDSRP